MIVLFLTLYNIARCFNSPCRFDTEVNGILQNFLTKSRWFRDYDGGSEEHGQQQARHNVQYTVYSLDTDGTVELLTLAKKRVHGQFLQQSLA